MSFDKKILFDDVNNINQQLKEAKSLKSILDIYINIGEKFQFNKTNNIQTAVNNILYCCELANIDNVHK